MRGGPDSQDGRRAGTVTAPISGRDAGGVAGTLTRTDFMAAFGARTE